MPALTPNSGASKIHFCGIGGAGMVAVARLALEAGWEVRGSDNPLYPPTSDMVDALGVSLAEGYAAKNLDWGPDLVVVGNALSRGNPEVEALLDRGLPYTSFPEWLRHFVLQGRHSIVVTGTHGKTTTTTLIAHVLAEAGRDPGYVIGGQPVGLPASSRLGSPTSPFVIEGDEYDTAFFDKRAKFFHYLPRTAVVTSLEFDHGDIYDDVDAVERAFRLMLRQIPPSGHLLLCADHPRALALRDAAFSNVVTYGFADDAEWRVETGTVDGDGQSLTIHCQGSEWGTFKTPLFGRHNLQNVTASIVVAALHGMDATQIGTALSSFGGIRRRMEIFLKSDGITFVDDFAHHPTAIRETIAAAKARWPGERITVLFEPRSNTTATNRFQKELGDAFAGANEVWIGPIYRPDQYAEAERLDRAKLVASIERRGATAHYTDDAEAIVRHIRNDVEPHDVVLILSNGAFAGIYDCVRAHFSGQTDG